MTYGERKAQVRSYLGRTVEMVVDRPIGYVHHKKTYSLNYRINYGYIPGVLGGDGEELDVYLYGVSVPVARAIRAELSGLYIGKMMWRIS